MISWTFGIRSADINVYVLVWLKLFSSSTTKTVGEREASYLAFAYLRNIHSRHESETHKMGNTHKRHPRKYFAFYLKYATKCLLCRRQLKIRNQQYIYPNGLELSTFSETEWTEKERAFFRELNVNVRERLKNSSQSKKRSEHCESKFGYFTCFLYMLILMYCSLFRSLCEWVFVETFIILFLVLFVCCCCWMVFFFVVYFAPRVKILWIRLSVNMWLKSTRMRCFGRTHPGWDRAAIGWSRCSMRILPMTPDHEDHDDNVASDIIMFSSFAFRGNVCGRWKSCACRHYGRTRTLRALTTEWDGMKTENDAHRRFDAAKTIRVNKRDKCAVDLQVSFLFFGMQQIGGTASQRHTNRFEFRAASRADAKHLLLFCVY